MIDRIGELRKIARRGVNVGCGELPVVGLCNVDAINPKADVKADARNLPFPDASIHWLESHHMLEHLDKEGGIAAIKEWHRVLIPGGLLFITVPDLPRCFELILQNLDVPALWQAMMCSIYGCQNDEYDYHKYGYSLASLMSLVAMEGFEVEGFAWPYKSSPTIGILAKKNN